MDPIPGWARLGEAPPSPASPAYPDDVMTAAFDGLNADAGPFTEGGDWLAASPTLPGMMNHAAAAAAAAAAMNRRDPLDGSGWPTADGQGDGGGLDELVYGGRPPMHAAVGRTEPPTMEAAWAASVAGGPSLAHDNHQGPSACESSNPSSTVRSLSGKDVRCRKEQEDASGVAGTESVDASDGHPEEVGHHKGGEEEEEDAEGNEEGGLDDGLEPAQTKPLTGSSNEAHSLKWSPCGYEILPASEAGGGSGCAAAHGEDGSSGGRGGGGGGSKRSGKCSYGSDRGLVCVNTFPPELTPRVSLSRSLIRSNDGGVHRWNKSWLFPEVTVRVDPVSAAAAATSVQVLVVTSPANPSVDGPIKAAGGSEGTVENAGLGTSDTSRVVQPCRPQALLNGKATFTRLRLRATSYALGGRRFSLVVVVFDASGAVLSSIVSSPFLVHARIDGAPPRLRWSTPRTRRSSRSGAYNFSAFDVDTFSRVYVKRSSVKGRGPTSTVKELIDNSALGLLRYFTAPNIRNKSRHPLLLVVRFSAALLLSRDVERYPVFDDHAATAFIAACGTVLPNAVDPDAGVPGVETTPLVPWILSLRSPSGAVGGLACDGGAGGSSPNTIDSEARAVVRLREMLGNLRGPAVGWVADATVLPPRYAETTDTDLMRRVYTRLRALADAAGPAKEPVGGERGSSGGGGGGGRLSRKRPPSGSVDDSAADRKPSRTMLPSSGGGGSHTHLVGSPSRPGFDPYYGGRQLMTGPCFAPGPFPRSTIADGVGGKAGVGAALAPSQSVASASEHPGEPSSSLATHALVAESKQDWPRPVGGFGVSMLRDTIQSLGDGKGVGEQLHYGTMLGRVPPSGAGNCDGSSHGATHHSVAAEVADGGTKFNPRFPIHRSFDAAFRKCHTLLNGVAYALQQEATAAFSSGIQDNGRGLVIALKAMKAALRGHHLEEKLLYDALRSRTPGVCESYVIDQLRSVERLDELDIIIRAVVADVNKLGVDGTAGASPMGADLFMKSSHFTRLLAEKCSKEEDHLLPYFFRRFSLPELSNLLYVLEVSLAEAVAREREAAASESQSGERASGRF
ncbi:hypothetical protein MMPV_002981 [Pyropia vietnamensis]